MVKKIGNIVHESVPVSMNEDENGLVKKWGEPDLKRVIDGSLGNLHHHQVLRLLDGFDAERGAKVAGHRGYFLKGAGVLLNMALIQYGMQFLNKRDYTIMQTPYFMKHSIMSQTCQLSDFAEQLYTVLGDNSDPEETKPQPYYLIATSEQPISGYFYKEWLKEKDLPIKFAGFSSCFRKEAGAHGKDVWGIFRIHQFEKIEQFCLTTPEKSWEMQEEMIKVCEEFYQSLLLPYRIVNIVSGALNDAAAKKYDLEAWFPGYGTYRELVSCSNCTDFQSRGLEVRCGTKKSDVDKKYAHMLNSTLCATERTLCCILENYQTKDGINIPKPLQLYVGAEFLPFKKNLVEEYLKEVEEMKKETECKEKKEQAKKEKKAKKSMKTKEPKEEAKEEQKKEEVKKE